MKTIQSNARVVLEYTLRDDKGAVLDASDADDGEPIVYVHGYGMLVPGLEAGLDGLAAGDERKIVVAPDEAFGDRDEELVMEVDLADFPDPKKVSAGDEVVAESPDGDEVPMVVVEVKADSVVVDANHPLAGKTLHYEVKVREVAAATEDEIAEAAEAFDEASGCDDPTHNHGPGGHHHGPGHSHDHGHDHGPGHSHGPNGQGGELVQLKSKKSPPS